MTIECFTNHTAYLKDWPGGISVCLLCAAKHEMAQDARTCLLKAKLNGLDYNCVDSDTIEGGSLHKKLDKPVRPECPRCKRSNILYRIKTNDFICRLCGHKFKKEME